MRVSPEEFIRAWQESSSWAEVVAKVGGSEKSVQVRASAYRHKGIPLKYFPGGAGRPKFQLDKLIALAQSLAPKEE